MILGTQNCSSIFSFSSLQVECSISLKVVNGLKVGLPICYSTLILPMLAGSGGKTDRYIPNSFSVQLIGSLKNRSMEVVEVFSSCFVPVLKAIRSEKKLMATKMYDSKVKKEPSPVLKVSPPL